MFSLNVELRQEEKEEEVKDVEEEEQKEEKVAAPDHCRVTVWHNLPASV